MRPETGQSLYAKHWRVLQIALIVLAGAVVYANSFQGRPVLDDYAVINGYGPQDPVSLMINGGARRVANLTFALNYQLHGEQVPGYHLVNLAIHLLAAVTLYFLAEAALAALSRSYPPGSDTPQEPDPAARLVPFAAALLFTLHPLQTQAVSYIAQRYTSLATLCYLLSALCYVRARLALAATRALVPAGASLLAGLLALGSKQIAATLPLMLLVLELFLFRGRGLTRKFWLTCAGCILLAVLAAALAWYDRPPGELLSALHNATAEDRYTTRTAYLITQIRVVATYLRLLCLPYGQSLLHDYPLVTALYSAPVLAALALHLSLLAAMATLLRSSELRLRRGEAEAGSLQRLAALGIAWFYLAIAVESSIFPITDVIFEHRVYLPSAGFLLTVTSLALLILADRPHGLVLCRTLLALVAIVLGCLTINRNHLWNAPLLLWQDTVRKAPGKELALANLAREHMLLNELDKALPLFVRALEMKPRSLNFTKIYLGMTLQELGVDGSRLVTGEDMQATVATRRMNRMLQSRLDGIMHNNLGLANEMLGNPAGALRHYRNAVALTPDFDRAWYNLGLLAIRNGDRRQADAALTELKNLDPTLAGRLSGTMPIEPGTRRP